jgi:hypothetical protein
MDSIYHKQYLFSHDVPEDGLKGPKRIEAASQNNK